MLGVDVGLIRYARKTVHQKINRGEQGRMVKELTIKRMPNFAALLDIKRWNDKDGQNNPLKHSNIREIAALYRDNRQAKISASITNLARPISQAFKTQRCKTGTVQVLAMPCPFTQIDFFDQNTTTPAWAVAAFSVINRRQPRQKSKTETSTSLAFKRNKQEKKGNKTLIGHRKIDDPSVTAWYNLLCSFSI